MVVAAAMFAGVPDWRERSGWTAEIPWLASTSPSTAPLVTPSEAR
jgi:hypothetical protein